MEISIAGELLLELADRFAGDGQMLVFSEAAIANALDGAHLLPTDLREQLACTGFSVSRPAPATYGTILLPAPPNRDLLRRQLLISADLVAEGGTLLIAGANAEGGKSAIRDAESLLGQPRWSGFREKHRLGIFRRSDLLLPDWATSPGIAPGTWESFAIETPFSEIPLQTQAGVFAGAKLDAGTRLLLEHIAITPGDQVLDLGCGVGVIGIVAAKLGARVSLTDANLVAVEAADHNLRALELNGMAIASDVYDQLGATQFDQIISNPPFHRGKQVDLTVANRIIKGAPQRLREGGSLTLVANAFLAYDKQMRQVFSRVEIVAQTPQYHVLRGW